MKSAVVPSVQKVLNSLQEQLNTTLAQVGKNDLMIALSVTLCLSSYLIHLPVRDVGHLTCPKNLVGQR